MIEKYEYLSPIELDSIASNYFIIPASIILSSETNDKRISVFSYFSIRRGLDYNIFFSVNNIVKWLGKQPNRHKNGINNKIIENINFLNTEGYLTLSEELINTSCTEAIFNLDKISYECKNNRFAVVYLDELNKILSYTSNDNKETFTNNDVTLLVFTYLRMKIYKRRNKLMPEEINIDNKNNHQYDIKIRKSQSPDAYDCYYQDIAHDLGLTDRIVSKAVNILKELELIYFIPLKREQYYNNKTGKYQWKTGHTIFCNMYKREGNCLLASGQDYYLTEINNKMKNIEEYKMKRGG